MVGKIERILDQGMTVHQLIQELQRFPSSAVVVFTADYGDRVHTIQAIPVTECEIIGEGNGDTITETAYSRSGLAYRDSEWVEKYHDGESEKLPVSIVRLS